MDSLGDEPGDMPPPIVPVGGTVKQIATGTTHSCALLDTGAVRCWGRGEDGKLGYGNTDSVGDEPGEMPPPDVPVGGMVIQIAASFSNTCALMDTGAVRCWGDSSDGALGYIRYGSIGDDVGEMPPIDVPVL
jgi:hypothetical protein